MSSRHPNRVRAAFSRRLTALTLPAAVLIGLMCGSGTAMAQEVRRIAAISLLGDKMTVVQQQERTGTHINRNTAETLDLPAGVIDVTSLSGIGEAVAKADPKSAFVPLKLPSATMFGDPDKLFANSKFLVPAQLDAILKQVKASHLLVVTPFRAPANIKGWREGIGSGSLEGVGFYMDRDLPITWAESNQRQIGYIAPYTYFKVWLVNLAGMDVAAQKSVAQSFMTNSDRKEGANDPWQAYSDKDKLLMVTDMLKKALVDSVPAMIQNP
jgi:hypothetical protein